MLVNLVCDLNFDFHHVFGHPQLHPNQRLDFFSVFILYMMLHADHRRKVHYRNIRIEVYKIRFDLCLEQLSCNLNTRFPVFFRPG